MVSVDHSLCAATSWAELGLAADRCLADLAQHCGAQAALAGATAAHLGRLTESQAASTSQDYRVFRCAATRQLILLREVRQLTGATEVFAARSVADALQWMNAQLATLSATRPSAPAAS